MQETIRIADGAFEERLGYKFSARELLERALTHSSAVPELRTAGAEEAVSAFLPRDNERLEFLGDAVLELLTSEYLLATFPEWSEGQLSKSRARIVNAGSLEAAARRRSIASPERAAPTTKRFSRLKFGLTGNTRRQVLAIQKKKPNSARPGRLSNYSNARKRKAETECRKKL